MNRVHLSDCMEFMKQLPDNHYDLAIRQISCKVNYNIQHICKVGRLFEPEDIRPQPVQTELSMGAE